MKPLGLLAATCLVVGGIFLTGAHASTPNHDGDPATRVITLRPCEFEDSPNCYWDAGARGNGVGHSFDALRVGHKVCIRYWDNRYDRRHGHCVSNPYPLGG